MDGDDLPDADYASIYGHAALHARELARFDAALKHHDEIMKRLEVLRMRADALLRKADEPPRRE
jgi:hypothetical protein